MPQLKGLISRLPPVVRRLFRYSAFSGVQWFILLFLKYLFLNKYSVIASGGAVCMAYAMWAYEEFTFRIRMSYSVAYFLLGMAGGLLCDTLMLSLPLPMFANVVVMTFLLAIGFGVLTTVITHFQGR